MEKRAATQFDYNVLLSALSQEESAIRLDQITSDQLTKREEEREVALQQCEDLWKKIRKDRVVKRRPQVYDFSQLCKAFEEEREKEEKSEGREDIPTEESELETEEVPETEDTTETEENEEANQDNPVEEIEEEDGEKAKRSGHMVVNWMKKRHMGRVMREFLRFQECEYLNVKPNLEIQSFLRNMSWPSSFLSLPFSFARSPFSSPSISSSPSPAFLSSPSWQAVQSSPSLSSSSSHSNSRSSTNTISPYLSPRSISSPCIRSYSVASSARTSSSLLSNSPSLIDFTHDFMSVLSEKELYALSLKIEPRKSVRLGKSASGASNNTKTTSITNLTSFYKRNSKRVSKSSTDGLTSTSICEIIITEKTEDQPKASSIPPMESSGPVTTEKHEEERKQEHANKEELKKGGKKKKEKEAKEKKASKEGKEEKKKRRTLTAFKIKTKHKPAYPDDSSKSYCEGQEAVNDVNEDCVAAIDNKQQEDGEEQEEGTGEAPRKEKESKKKSKKRNGSLLPSMMKHFLPHHSSSNNSPASDHNKRS